MFSPLLCVVCKEKKTRKLRATKKAFLPVCSVCWPSHIVLPRKLRGSLFLKSKEAEGANRTWKEGNLVLREINQSLKSTKKKVAIRAK